MRSSFFDNQKIGPKIGVCNIWDKLSKYYISAFFKFCTKLLISKSLLLKIVKILLTSENVNINILLWEHVGRMTILCFLTMMILFTQLRTFCIQCCAFFIQFFVVLSQIWILPYTEKKVNKGLFINNVIIFGGCRDPPPPNRHHSSLFGYPPSHVRVTRDKTAYVGLLTIVESPL